MVLVVREGSLTRDREVGRSLGGGSGAGRVGGGLMWVARGWGGWPGEGGEVWCWLYEREVLARDREVGGRSERGGSGAWVGRRGSIWAAQGWGG